VFDRVALRTTQFPDIVERVSSDDDARRKFLATLVTALGEPWVAGYAEIQPFGVLGLTLRRQGVDGFVQVVPSVVDNNVISWRPFPGTGRPHFDLKPDGTGHLRTCILDAAVAALERWALSKQPVKRSPPEPMLPAMRPRLDAIAAAKPATVEDAIDIKPWSLTAAGKQELADARTALDPTAIARAFPRDDDGRLTLDEQVLLTSVASSKPLAEGRGVYLAVRGPRVRRDGDRLELVLVDAIEHNETHRWFDAPWLWRNDATHPKQDARAAECVALLDAGRFDEALALYGIVLGASAVKILEGIPLGSHATHVSEWRATLRRTLWLLAPWRLANITAAGRLVLFPHQHHQMKSWIAFHPPGTIELENTGSNARLAQCRWRREVDLAPAPASSPSPPPRKLAKAARRAEPAPKPLAELIAGKQLWKATTALDHAKRRPARDAMAELVTILAGDGPSTERANAMWIASAIASPEDGPTLARYLDDRSPEVRRMTFDAIKRTRYTDAIPTLAAIVCASRRGERVEGVSAATAMKSLSGKRGASGLVGYFASDDPRVREAACHAFTMFDDGHKLARPYLEKALLDSDPAVVAAAKDALTTINARA
jgi:hypothetical protein